jgi:glycosyltransferase involved in cell wall biosynthesis
MPSRAEGLALTYLEALCMGVPIVGFPPNVQELEQALGRTVGFRFEADVDSVSQLAEHILTVCRQDSPISSQDRKTLSAAVRSRFSIDAFHRNYTEFFRNLNTG